MGVRGTGRSKRIRGTTILALGQSRMVQEYNPDTVGLQELCQNPYASKASLTVADMLRTRESVIRSITSHNKREGRENVGTYKPGGTAVVIRDYLSGYVRASGADHTGLGQWSWYSVTGADGVCTRFLSGYAPSGSASSGDQTFYKQCLRYIQTKKLRTTPQRMFQDDLLSVIDVWLGKKDRVVLMMDANEHVLEEKLPKASG